MQARPRSYTQLSQFSECGKQYELTRVHRVPTQQAAWFPGGRAFHATTERLDRETFAGETPFAEANRETLAGWWSDEFDKAVEEARQKEPDVTLWRTAGRPTVDKPRGEDVDWWRTAGLEMVNRYADWWVSGPPWRVWEMPDGKPALEVALLANLGAVRVVAYVDQVLQHRETGRLLVVDKKTGRRRPPIPIQLATYNVELQAVFPAHEFRWGAYYMARDAVLTEPEPLSHWDAALLAEQYRVMDEAESRGLYLANVGQHCSGCLVRKWCPPAGGQRYEEAA